MKLLVRSQDKKHLILPDHINIINNQIYASTPVDYATIGIYKTEERCIEVLDEIQKRLTVKFTVNGNYEKQDLVLKAYLINATSPVIYQMPKE